MKYMLHLLLIIFSSKYRLFRIYAILARDFDGVDYNYKYVLERYFK